MSWKISGSGGSSGSSKASSLGLDKGKYHVEVWCLARGRGDRRRTSKEGIPVKVLGLKSYYNPRRILDPGPPAAGGRSRPGPHPRLLREHLRSPGGPSWRAGPPSSGTCTRPIIGYSASNMRIEALLSLSRTRSSAFPRPSGPSPWKPWASPKYGPASSITPLRRKGNGSQGADLACAAGVAGDRGG